MDRLDRLNDMHIVLPSYDQIAPRVYINSCLCFPFDDACHKKKAYSHLRSALDRLGEQIPLLTGTLRLGWDGNVRVVLATTGSAAQIPMGILLVGGQQFASPNPFTYFESYHRLADSGFTAHAFTDKFWDLNKQLKISNGPVPVAYVRCVFIPKGLILFLHLHHSLAGATGLRAFAEGFAAVSRGQLVKIPRSPILTLPVDDDIVDMTSTALARDCSEYFVLHRGAVHRLRGCKDPDEAETSQTAMEGRTFIFSKPRLVRLRNKLHEILGQDARPVSIYVCLASLAFAHIYRVRMACEEGHQEVSSREPARLFTPVDWRPRYFKNETAQYFGNTALTQVTEIPQQDLHSACTDASLRALARLAARITHSLASVDHKAVLKRDALVKKVSDPRQLTPAADPRRPPHELHFDTLRFLGEDTRWAIPGVTATDRPDAVRAVPPGGYARPGAVILPARPGAGAGAETYEVHVALPSVSVRGLCGDLGWLAWVDRVSRFHEHLEGN